MKPLDIQELSQPLIDVYIGLENDMMMNIVKQLVKHNDITDTAKWQILKLSEIGALNKANLQTIANAIGGNKDLLEIILQEAALNSINEIEPALLEATRKGILEGATEPIKSTKVARVLKHFQNQAEDTLNLVNTVMQYKAKEKYSQLVNKVADIANKQEFLNILNKNTGETITGAISRQQALRQTLIEFNNKGIPAFVDKLGREWSPEGYLNMDIRTTTSNVAHETQFARMEDYGSDLIEVSSHSGSRPKCAKDQGKVYSRSGKTKGYPKFSTTSFGEPDGLLGINCGHMIYPYFEGISTQRFFPEDEEENNRKYKESQIQRALERDVRKSKRKAMLLNEAGDKEAFQKASIELKAKEQRLKQFTKDNKRPRRKDREQVFGFDKSVSQKAVQANKNSVSQKANKNNNNEEIKTTEDAKKALTNKVGFTEVEDSFMENVDPELIIKNTRQLNKLEDKYGIIHSSTSTTICSANRNDDAVAYVANSATNPTRQSLSLCPDSYSNSNKLISYEKLSTERRQVMPKALNDEELSISSVTHEYGHMLQNKLIEDEMRANGWTPDKPMQFINAKKKSTKAVLKWYTDIETKVKKSCYDEIIDIAKKNNPNFDFESNISKYGKESYGEFFAEVFMNAELSKPNELGLAMRIWLKEKGLGI